MKYTHCILSTYHFVVKNNTILHIVYLHKIECRFDSQTQIYTGAVIYISDLGNSECFTRHLMFLLESSTLCNMIFIITYCYLNVICVV